MSQSVPSKGTPISEEKLPSDTQRDTSRAVQTVGKPISLLQPSATLFGGLFGPAGDAGPFGSAFAPRDVKVKPPVFLGVEKEVGRQFETLQPSAMQCEDIEATRESTPIVSEEPGLPSYMAKLEEGEEIPVEYTSGSLVAVKMWTSSGNKGHEPGRHDSSKNKHPERKVNGRSHKDDRSASIKTKPLQLPVSSGASKLAAIFGKGPAKVPQPSPEHIEQKLQEKMFALEKMVKGGAFMQRPSYDPG